MSNMDGNYLVDSQGPQDMARKLKEQLTSEGRAKAAEKSPAVPFKAYLHID
jgi:hypothetical protein